MKLAEGRGFAGGLAAVVETAGGCTYRIVVAGGGGGSSGSGSGSGAGGRLDTVNVHVSFCFRFVLFCG